jgi:hypothetical protein
MFGGRGQHGPLHMAGEGKGELQMVSVSDCKIDIEIRQATTAWVQRNANSERVVKMKREFRKVREALGGRILSTSSLAIPSLVRRTRSTTV